MDTQRLKDKILQLAIQGKLVEQDKNDEPASELLQRIKEERDKLIKEKKIRKPKKLPPIEEDEKPFEIPEGWEWVRLGEVVNILGNKKEKGLKLPYLDVEFLRGKDTNNFKDTGMLSKAGDILILVDGQNSGELFEVKEIGYVGSTLRKLHISKELYIQYIVKNIEFNQKIYVDNKTGSAIPHLNRNLFNNTLIPLPPPAEQKRIVEKVDELFALIDELDSNKKDLLEVINLTRNQVLQEAIQGKLVEQNPEDEPASVLIQRIKEERDKLVREGKIRKPKKLPPIKEEEKPFAIPEGWEWVRLGEVGAIVGGGTPKTSVKEYWEGGTIPWLTPADLSNYTDKYISRGKRNITPLGLKESSAQLMPKGTVLFSSRAPIGYTVISQNEICTNQGFKSCIPFIINMNEYLYYYLIYSAKLINENASGTTFKEVSGTEVSKLILPLPPLAEQKRIVEKVDMIMEMLDKLEKELIINI
ncbi:restriction endonuclease subunit S [Garciella nitratireducens]|uniref:Type I restriction enzyme, S subunit n=1 Tax=Garciella nitratireducens DSM 15102 TaxID=1121911 RepID=A0A1T4NHC2_9FIRM|nr:restriction endonuclease subunit S [Garciella nitratireducens]SJZ78634.1 type I restriction enzyme, S subunit [Garciella nitratireducens DSM 15102]